MAQNGPTTGTAGDTVDPVSASPSDSTASGGTSRQGVQLIRELVRLHPLPFVVAVTGAAVYAAATVGSTIVLGRVTDDVIFPTFETGEIPSNALALGVAAVAAMTFLRVTGVVTRRYFAGMTSERNQRTLRRRLGSQYLSLPLSWHQRTPAGQLLAHADNDTEMSTELLHPLPFSLGVVFLAVFSAGSLLVIDVWLAVVAFLIFPALTLLNRIYSRRIEGPAAEVQASVGHVSTIAHESFDGALIVKTLGRADAESRRFDAAAQTLRRHRVTVGYVRAFFEVVMEALPNLGIVVVVVFGTYRIGAGAISRGDLVQVAALFTVLALPMRVLGFFLEMVPPSVVSRRRLEGVFRQPVPPQPDPPSPLPGGPLSVDLRGVTFQYPTVDPATLSVDRPAPSVSVEAPPVVLRQVDLTIEPGEVVALVGSTGSGKSTLCSLVSGLVPPSSGVIEVGGVSLDAVSELERSASVALVFQESFLFADTLRANVELGPAPGTPAAQLATPVTDRELERAASIAHVDEFVERLPAGWETPVGERGVTLSGGQRQRVALARALARRPRLLILDDATSAVDPRIELRILEALRATKSTTTLIVAQRVSTIALADRVLYLADGRIAASGSHAELLANPGYRALAEAYEAAGR
ncbi:MAG: ABC transporter ATP-binding protein [Actinomycetota bacterium]